MDKPAHRLSRKDTLLSRRHIEGLIAEGKHVMIYENRVLRVDAWIKYHPGGDKPIKHMVGRDATDEINAYVLEWQAARHWADLITIRLI
jgi:delta8-fatty-acid desaturase